MLQKLAKQTAVYGVSTIIGRFLSYLLTPLFTRVFSTAEYGVYVDVYALIPFALVVLTMGMESSYFRFAAKESTAEGKRRVFATTWGITSLAAAVFLVAVAVFDAPLSRLMGEAYEAQPLYVALVGAIVAFDVWAIMPFARLREAGRAKTFVGLKLLNIIFQVAFAVAFAAAGLYDSDFGVGWAFVANLAASVLTLLFVVGTTDRIRPSIDKVMLVAIFAYSLPLLVSGVAGTATEFIDRQMIKYLTPLDAMSQLGIYGAVLKISVVMVLFTQMYRLAAEPFFLSNFKKSDFVAMNAAALKYYVMVSMAIFLGIALFKDFFALIVGAEFRSGIYILPVVMGANILSGVWLNMSFWYKREERTRFAVVITLVGLAATVGLSFMFVPRWGYYGAAWVRLISEAAMVAVSYYLNRRYFPTPYDVRRIAEYVAVALGLYVAAELLARGGVGSEWLSVAMNGAMFVLYLLYAVWREKIDVKGLFASVLRAGRK